jgi:hypothetical protein
MSRDWPLVVLGLLGGIGVLSIYPFRLVGEFRHDDTVAHCLAGTSISLLGAGWYPGRNDAVFLATVAAGVVWEPFEGAYFRCDRPSLACLGEVKRWMLREDTWLDIAKVALGAFLGLRGTGRYD